MDKKKEEVKEPEKMYLISHQQIQFVSNALLEMPAKHSFNQLQVLNTLKEQPKVDTKPKG